jgi:hypothetical protein
VRIGIDGVRPRREKNASGIVRGENGKAGVDNAKTIHLGAGRWRSFLFSEMLPPLTESLPLIALRLGLCRTYLAFTYELVEWRMLG